MFVLHRFLFEPNRPLWRYCLLAGPIALLPSVALLVGVCFILEALGVNTKAFMPPGPDPTLAGLFGTVVFAPVLETLLLGWFLSVLTSLGKDRIFVAISSAILWGGLHSLHGLLWFFGTVWSFFVFSAAYLAWRPTSFKHAFVAAATTHAFVNLVAAIVIFDNASNPSSAKVDVDKLTTGIPFDWRRS